jgi:hypothetical protein
MVGDITGAATPRCQLLNRELQCSLSQQLKESKNTMRLVSLELPFHYRKEDCYCSGREVNTVVPCRGHAEAIELRQSLHIIYENISHISNAYL